MITERELEISNESYVNKSFADVYPELLEITQKITERWNPTTSNESDPGIVLMKLAAFVADKNNYNIDKNILEAFMPSATQESSMRKLCEMNGYSMKYYRSAITPISFMYNGSLVDEDGTNLSFSLKRYSTVVKAEDDSLTYTLIADCPIAYSGVTSTALAIEGSVHLLTVGDESVIRLVNLDENNRLYLPERMIAENGIFIHDVDSNNAWVQVSNLSVQVLSSKVFKFGYDSQRGLPYVEFPSDIASLIGSGLYVYYTTTSGIQGNTAAGTITALSAPDQIEADQLDANANPIVISDLTERLSINNAAAATTGSNPESIEEAYANFKRVVGTFDTLVTCRDYANFIYNIVDAGTLNYLVSNVQAADRRQDYNYANRVITFAPDEGAYAESFTSINNITPYDLCLYPLKPITAGYTQAAYDNSFKPLELNNVTGNETLQEAKCLSHNFKELDADDIYCFKNKYNLDIKISTYEKLNAYQQGILLNNVKTALYKNFNARMVEWGEAIPRDILKKVIKEADSRISDVDFENWNLVTYFMTKDGNEVAFSEQADASALETLVAKNILAGTISLFEYTDSYELEFGQKHLAYAKYKEGEGEWTSYNSSGYSRINSVDTEVKIPHTDAIAGTPGLDEGYVLQANEVLQFLEPTLQSAIQFGTYVNYRFEGHGSTPVSANSSYLLTGGDKLSILYTDADTGLEKSFVYTASTVTEDGVIVETNATNIIKPSFELGNIDESVVSSSIIRNGIKYLTLNANQTIDKQVYVKTVLNDAILRCYWIMNNPTNTLFKADGSASEIILEDGEFFIYSNSSLTELTVLGSGTRLKLASAPAADWTISDENLISIENISDQGLAAFGEVNWQSKYLTNNTLTIERMTVSSFAEGDKVKLSAYDTTIVYPSNKPYVGNNWQALPSSATVDVIKADGSIVTLPELPAIGADGARLVRSYLNLNCGPNKPQVLRCNHLVQLKYIPKDQTESPLYYALNQIERDWWDTDMYDASFKSNYLLQRLGGENLEVASVSTPLYSIEVEEGVRFVLYSDSPVVLDDKIVERNRNELFVFPLNQFNGESGLELPLLPIAEEDEYILMYFDKFTDNVTLTVKSNEVGMTSLEAPGAASNSINLLTGINVIKIAKGTGVNTLTLTHTQTLTSTDGDTLYVGKIKLIQGYNPAFDTLEMSDVLTKLQALSTIDGSNKFYYLYQPTSEEAMDASNMLMPEALWDKHNVANRITLAQIDFEASTISLTNASKL